MLRSMNIKIRYIFCLVSLYFSGCTYVQPPIVAIAPAIETTIPATTEDYSKIINSSAHNINSIKLSGKLVAQEPGLETLNCKITLLYKKDSNLFINAYKPLIPSLFQLKLKNNLFHLLIPDENYILTGDIETLKQNPDLNISIAPDLIQKALFPEKIIFNDTAKILHQQNETVLQIFSKNSSLKRLLYFENSSFRPEKEIFFSSKGYEEIIINRNNWIKEENNALIAKEITITKPITNTSIKLFWDKIKLNEKIEDEVFTFEFPEGVEVETL